MEICVAIKALNTAMEREMNRILAHTGVTAAQSQVLSVIVHANDKETHSQDIEQQLGLSHPTVSSILKRLEQKGLIQLIPSNEDRRYKRSVLTSSCAQLLGSINSEKEKINNRMLAGLTEAEQKEFVRITEKIVRNLSE